jgi:hydroxypyruvate isomerase
MNRREFSQLTAVAALAHAMPNIRAQTASLPDGFKFSFMLWALKKQAPFDRRIEIVAEAGYNGVELVGEFQKWSSEETRRVMARMRSLRLVFDAMSGVRAGFCDAGESTEFLK